MISLKALHLLNQSGDSRKKILINSLLYTGGILFSMIVLAVIVITIKASGTALGWGFQFQNPLFVLILTSLVFLFSLSLFELFFINPPQKAGEAASTHKGGYGGSFFTGVMAVLLATPCTAPLLGTALGFAFVQPGGIILLFFVLIGLGLSLPFILLGFFPGLVKRLPKPGEWMNRFRELMGFLLAGTAIYLLTVLYRQLGEGFTGLLWFFLSLALGAWLFGLGQRRGKPARFLFFGAALLVVIVSSLLFIDLSPRESQEVSLSRDTETIPFSPERVEQIRGEGKSLFLEFSADWCATCRSNHLTVLDRDFRRELFEEYGVVYMVGDYTLNDPVISEWLKKFHRAGVPLYIYYEQGKEPVVLPEVLNRPLLEKTIRGN
ncbi:MAG: cytochrome c biogenesis protein CcdA [Spirochaetales bacterium]|nr:cytochrome c biogenesis protein CcdA [Spirochaetales bacterium]